MILEFVPVSDQHDARAFSRPLLAEKYFNMAGSGAGQPAQRVQVGGLIGGASGLLGVPENPAQDLHHAVLGRVDRAG